MTDKTTDKTIAVLKYAESALLGRDRAVTELARLTAQRDAVIALHRRLDSTPWCGVCVNEDNEEQAWPCETVRALGVTS